MKIKVLLTDLENWPDHNSGKCPRAPGQWNKWRGQPIWIFSQPKTPTTNWNCDTDKVFEVCPNQPVMDGLPTGYTAYVCEHQIQTEPE